MDAIILAFRANFAIAPTEQTPYFPTYHRDARTYDGATREPHVQNDRNAILLALLAILLLTVMDSIIKSLSARFNAAEIMYFRSGFGAILAGGLFLWIRPGWPNRAQWPGHVSRSLIMMATGLMFFHALGKLPLAELFVYTFTAPMFTALFGWLILKERLAAMAALGLALGFAGILLIVLTDPALRSGGAATSWDGLAAAILSPITYALAMVLLRKQAGGEPVPRIVFMQSLLTAGLLTPFMLPAMSMPVGSELAKALSIAALGTAGAFLLTMAFARAEAGKVIVAEYTGLIWAALIGYAVFAETPRPMVLVGAVLVIAGCLAVMRGKGAPKPAAAQLAEASK
jgi:drug/metabolite transporter (DMT)-like permease